MSVVGAGAGLTWRGLGRSAGVAQLDLSAGVGGRLRSALRELSRG